MGNSFLEKIIGKFRKSANDDDSQQESLMEKYGISDDMFHDNPLYEPDAANERYGAGQEQESSEAEQVVENVPLENDIQNIGGLPTEISIIKMLKGQDLGKIKKHKHFDRALEALKKYQDIMQAEQRIGRMDEVLGSRGGIVKGVQLTGDNKVFDDAWKAMMDFVYEANQAVKGAGGLFARRSSTVRRLTPVFANMLMQAYGVMPKLSHVESAIAPYLIERDIEAGRDGGRSSIEDVYTLNDVLNHRVSGGRSGGLALRGFQEKDSAIVLSPKKALEVAKSSREAYRNEEGNTEIEEASEKLRSEEEKNKQAVEHAKNMKEQYRQADGAGKKGLSVKFTRAMNDEYQSCKHLNLALIDQMKAEQNRRMDIAKVMQEFREEETQKARMAMTIPKIPAGREGILEPKAQEIADSYIAELKLLMTALDDAAEGHEFSDETERAAVHDKQAEHFRLSRLLYRVMGNRELLKDIILNGWTKGLEQREGYADFALLEELANVPLSAAVDNVNMAARNVNNFERLVDKRTGEELKEDTKEQKNDYFFSGGNASQVILDRRNQRVFRKPDDMADGGATALNGIKDEAAGKVDEFLGFNVCAKAEAVGFMARKKGSNEEEAVFGGSVMDMAKGSAMIDTNIVLRPGDEKEGKKNVELLKHGKILGDYMKLSILDYILQHCDRNARNFFVNPDAGAGESSITGIDNDMILGYEDQGVRHGGAASADMLNGIDDKFKLNYSARVRAAVPMMTREVKEALLGLDLGALNELLMPYADRVVRLGAVHRAAELKAMAENMEVCDLTTPEGTKVYFKALARSTMADWIKYFHMNAKGEVQYKAANPQSIGILSSLVSRDRLYESMRNIGLSKEEAKEMLIQNLSGSYKEDTGFTREEFENSLENEKFEAVDWDEKYVI